MQWYSNRVCRVGNAHGPSAVGPKICRTLFFFRTRARNQPRTVCQHFSLQWIELALRSRNVSLLLIMDSVAMTFGFPSILLSASDDELYTAAESLAKQYYTDISSAFPPQLLSFRSCVHSQLSTKSTNFEVSHLLLSDYHALSSIFSGVCIVRPTLLLLTLPVTVATCERSFAKLKLIFLRSTTRYVSGASQ